MGRTPDPDGILIARLTGTAGRLVNQMIADDTATVEAAVAELRELAGGRTDLLAHVAGTALGTADTSLDAARQRRQAELCILAGADETLIEGHAAEVRRRLSRPLHQSHD